jgi:hypothetical protein
MRRIGYGECEPQSWVRFMDMEGFEDLDQALSDARRFEFAII